MKFLFVADPIAKLNPKGDSTLAMARAALAQKIECSWVSPDKLWLRGTDVWAAAETIAPFAKDRLPTGDATGKTKIDDYDAVFIRKDPPFDADYVRLCWWLSLYDKKVYQFNRATLLLRYHEKMLPFEAVHAGFLKAEDLIPTFIGSFTRAESFAKEQSGEEVVAKPFLGHGGETIYRLKIRELSPKSIKETETMMWQPLLKEVSELGDRRVLYLNGEILGDIVRVPKPGSIVSNLAQGGSAVHRPMNADELRVAEALGRFLKQEGIVFAGSDMIGANLSEVNVTSPTGLRSLEALHGDDKAAEIIKAVVSQVSL